MGTMTEAAKEARRAYKRAWTKNNPDKIRAQQERYWNRRAMREAALQNAEQADGRTAEKEA